MKDNLTKAICNKRFRRRCKSNKKRRLRNYGKQYNLISRKEKKRKGVITDLEVRRKHRNFRWIIAPPFFSFIDEPEKTIDFINKIEKCFVKRSKVFIDLAKVEKIDHGAITVLLAKMIAFKSNKIPFNGNFPKNSIIRAIIEKSGFFEYLDYDDINIEDKYKIVPSAHKIFTHANRNIDSNLADEVITIASENIWKEKRRCIGVGRVLVELMHNTNNHASENKKGEKHWWLSVNYNKKENKVSFSFIDFGIGIIKSLEAKKGGQRFYNIFNIISKMLTCSNDGEFIKLLLEGKIHEIEKKTSTGKYYRGKGLPGINRAFNKNDMSNLRVISNKGYVDSATNSFKELSCSLNGTFIYWELNVNNRNFDYEYKYS